MGFARRKIGVDWQGKLDPEDLMQEAYIDVFKAINTFTWQGEDSFYHWLARIIDHKFIDAVRALRRKKRDATREISTGGGAGGGAGGGKHQSRHDQLLDHLKDSGFRPSQLMRREDAVGAMMASIAKLPDEYRIIIQRVNLGGETYAEVAKDLNKTEDAVRRAGGRAIEKLNDLMGSRSRYLSWG